MAKDSVATFFTTHQALRAEKVLKEAGLGFKLIPTPRYLSADCTLALVFLSTDYWRVKAIFEEQSVETSGFHELR